MGNGLCLFIWAAQLCYCNSLLWQKIRRAELLTHFSGRMMLQNPGVLLKSLACNPTLLLQIAWNCSLLLNSSFTEQLMHRAQVGSPCTNNPTFQRLLPMPQREVTRNSIHTRIFILINSFTGSGFFFLITYTEQEMPDQVTWIELPWEGIHAL